MGPCIYQKVEYVREMREIIASGVKWPFKVFLQKHRPGAYSGCFTKEKHGWFARSESDKWQLFVEKCPRQAQKYKELPNWARTLLGVQLMKGRHDESMILPQVASKAIEMLIMHALRDGQEVTSAAVSATIEWGLAVYNEEAKYVNSLVQDHNDALLQQLDDRAGELLGPTDIDDIAKGGWKYVQEVDASKLESAKTYHTQRFKKEWGFGTYGQKKPERMLDPSDPKTIAYQEFINSAAEKKE